MHRQLDSHVGELGAFTDTKRYAVYLQTMRRLYQAYAAPLDRFSELADLPLQAAFIIDCIDRDLAGLAGESHVAGDAVSSEKAATEDAGVSDDAAHGVGYTLEGSALGAKYLLQYAQKELPEGTPMAFITELQSHAATRWPIALEALLQADCDVDVAVENAKAVFLTAIELFSGHAGTGEQ